MLPAKERCNYSETMMLDGKRRGTVGGIVCGAGSVLIATPAFANP
jgi:hypothetical protein